MKLILIIILMGSIAALLVLSKISIQPLTVKQTTYQPVFKLKIVKKATNGNTLIIRN